jgi:hypothetical protein
VCVCVCVCVFVFVHALWGVGGCAICTVLLERLYDEDTLLLTIATRCQMNGLPFERSTDARFISASKIQNFIKTLT